MFQRIACQASDWFAKPVVIAGIPLACIVWLLAGGSVAVLTNILSVLAISMTQLVLVGQNVSETIVQAKLDELVRAVPDADDALADLHRQTRAD